MTVSLFSFVDMYAKGLATLKNILEKGRAYAIENGIDEQQMLGWRLAEDMFPLWRQAQIVAILGHAGRCVRLACPRLTSRMRK